MDQPLGFSEEFAQLFPHVAFQGSLTLTDPDGQSLGREVSQLIIEPIVRQAVAPSLSTPRWQGTPTDLADTELVPSTIVDVGGMPSASANVTGKGGITIALGLMFAVKCLPSVMRDVQKYLYREQMRLDECAAYEPSAAVLAEMHGLLAGWQTSADTGWRGIVWTSAAREASDNDLLAEGCLLHLIVLHEVAHWQVETKFAEADRRELYRYTERLLDEWLTAPCPLDASSHDASLLAWSRASLSDTPVRASWVREITADQMAAHAVFSSGWGWGPLRKGFYSHLYVWFFLLQLFELFRSRSRDIEDFRSHPPARVRRALTAHSFRDTFGPRLPGGGAGTMAWNDFLGVQWAWPVGASIICDKILYRTFVGR